MSRFEIPIIYERRTRTRPPYRKRLHKTDTLQSAHALWSATTYAMQLVVALRGAVVLQERTTRKRRDDYSSSRLLAKMISTTKRVIKATIAAPTPMTML